MTGYWPQPSAAAALLPVGLPPGGDDSALRYRPCSAAYRLCSRWKYLHTSLQLLRLALQLACCMRELQLAQQKMHDLSCCKPAVHAHSMT